AWREPAAGALEEAQARVRHPIGRPAGDIEAVREALYDVMWNDVGILRDAAGLERARGTLAGLRARLDATGIAGGDLRYNLTWHDWLNLSSLIDVSTAICAAALAREDSRGAHYREDFPRTGSLEHSAYSRVTLDGAGLEVAWGPVRFTRVRPGETLLAA